MKTRKITGKMNIEYDYDGMDFIALQTFLFYYLTFVHIPAKTSILPILIIFL